MADDPFSKLEEFLKQIKESPPSVRESEEIGKEEGQALKERTEIDMLREQLRSMTQDTNERKRYAKKSFKLVKNWVIAVLVLLLLQGFLSGGFALSYKDFSLSIPFKLPDSVLLAVVGGTTVSIIGIFLVVANYLFPKK